MQCSACAAAGIQGYILQSPMPLYFPWAPVIWLGGFKHTFISRRMIKCSPDARGAPQHSDSQWVSWEGWKIVEAISSCFGHVIGTETKLDGRPSFPGLRPAIFRRFPPAPSLVSPREASSSDASHQSTTKYGWAWLCPPPPLTFDTGDLRGSLIAQKVVKNRNLIGKILRNSNLMFNKSLIFASHSLTFTIYTFGMHS